MELREILDFERWSSRGQVGKYHQAGELEADHRRRVEEGHKTDAGEQRGYGHEHISDGMEDMNDRPKWYFEEFWGRANVVVIVDVFFFVNMRTPVQ